MHIISLYYYHDESNADGADALENLTSLGRRVEEVVKEGVAGAGAATAVKASAPRELDLGNNR